VFKHQFITNVDKTSWAGYRRVKNLQGAGNVSMGNCSGTGQVKVGGISIPQYARDPNAM